MMKNALFRDTGKAINKFYEGFTNKINVLKGAGTYHPSWPVSNSKNPYLFVHRIE